MKIGDQLTLTGEIIATLDRGRIVVAGDDFGRVTVLAEFAEAI